jgi:hypothetical protein
MGGVLSSIVFVLIWDWFKKPALRFEPLQISLTQIPHRRIGANSITC